MSSKYSAYSEARSIARKRLERLNEAGYVTDNISFPTVKQLKERGISPGSALRSVEQFLKAPTKLVEFRKEQKAGRDLMFRQTSTGVQLGERERQLKRQRDARYRERVRSMTKEDRRLMKAARTLGLNITPSTAKAFSEYVKYRYSQGIGSVKYMMANIVEDFMAITAKGMKKAGDVIQDYERFLADRANLLDDWNKMETESRTAQPADKFHVSWLEYIQHLEGQRG